MMHSNPNMLVRIAQGDAYGMACEYVTDPDIRARALEFKAYLRHPKHSLRAGQYTDDTQMSIAVANVIKHLGKKWQEPLMEVGGPKKIKYLFADQFLSQFKADPRKGYAGGFQKFLEETRDTDGFLRNIVPHSDRNGAAMRSVPIGLIPDVEGVKAIATLQAQITHDTGGGITSSVSVALMSHFALYKSEPLSEMPDWLRSVIGGFERWDDRAVVGPDLGVNTARAAMTLVSEQPTLMDIARTALEWGGDTDSVLAVAWGIASTRMAEPLPEFFEYQLEDGIFGLRYLKQAGIELMETFA